MDFCRLVLKIFNYKCIFLSSVSFSVVFFFLKILSSLVHASLVLYTLIKLQQKKGVLWTFKAKQYRVVLQLDPLIVELTKTTKNLIEIVYKPVLYKSLNKVFSLPRDTNENALNGTTVYYQKYLPFYTAKIKNRQNKYPTASPDLISTLLHEKLSTRNRSECVRKHWLTHTFRYQTSSRLLPIYQDLYTSLKPPCNTRAVRTQRGGWELKVKWCLQRIRVHPD